MKVITTIMVLMTLPAWGQEETISLQKTYDVPDPLGYVLRVENIHGDVKVMGYQGNTIELNLEITIFEKRDGGLEQGVEDLSLGAYDLNDGMLLTMDAPWIKREWDNGRYSCHSFQRAPVNYTFHYRFSLKVPQQMHVIASTVNRGEVQVEGVQGPLSVSNVNGPISVEGAHEITEATTVNGDILINYAQNQTHDAEFHTVNGDIVLELRDSWDGEVSAESLNGDFFSAFDFEYLPAQLQQVTDRDKSGTVYKVAEQNTVAIGTGQGPHLKFETLQGDIYLKRIKS